MEKDIIKVLVVDDSAFMRILISDILKSDNNIRVVGTAQNGVEAIAKAKELELDVITLDVEMPVMDGLTCIKELRKIRNIPVIMLSSLTEAGAEATIIALENGAVDFIMKPTEAFKINSQDKKDEIIEKVKMVKKLHLNKAIEVSHEVSFKSNNFKFDTKEGRIKKIVAIGTSTGGPKALQDVIPLIPKSAPAAYLIVQHMPPMFTKNFADRLNMLSEISVKEAEDGDLIKQGHAYVAPGGYHMVIEGKKENNLKIKLTRDTPYFGLRPSVDVMMNSLSKTGIKNVIGVIMTGMGKDGREGLINLKKSNNGFIISQDENSCVVYGMPKAAFEANVVDVVVPLTEITSEIMKNLEV